MPVAHAGHDGLSDLSTMDQPYVEALVPPAEAALGRWIFPEADYCGVHFVVSKPPQGADGLPDEVDLDRRSLYVEGWWAAPGADVWQPFVAETGAAYGVIHDLDEVGSGAGARASVTFLHSARGTFDGLELADIDPDDLGYALLGNLVEHTTVQVSLTD